MELGDPETALQLLREFRALLVADERDLRNKRPRQPTERLFGMQPLIEDIARVCDPDRAERLSGHRQQFTGTWTWGTAIVEVDRLIGIVEQREVRQRVLGPAGPTLAASGLHPWVWNAAASLWDDGHYEPAVHEAAKAVELQTQLKVDRRDLDGKDLYAHAFSTKNPKPGEPRLRFPDIDPAEQLKRWTSALEGARNFGWGALRASATPRRIRLLTSLSRRR